jgi:hypothetical protein
MDKIPVPFHTFKGTQDMELLHRPMVGEANPHYPSV